MGADLIMAALVIDKDEEPDFGAGHAWIDALTVEQLDEIYEHREEDYFDEADEEYVDDDGALTEKAYDELRKRGHAAVDKLVKMLDPDNYYRDVTSIEVRGARVILSGGMSWGDSPTESSEDIWGAGQFFVEGGSLLEAMGFEFSGQEVRAVPFSALLVLMRMAADTSGQPLSHNEKKFLRNTAEKFGVTEDHGVVIA